jgi:leucyl aminopeptidase (aminopeptidase T)
MNSRWAPVARRMVEGLGVCSGECIEVEDGSCRPDVLQEVLREIDRVGATPLTRITSPDSVASMLAEASQEELEGWDGPRRDWLSKTDRKLIVGSMYPDLSSVPPAAVDAWTRAVSRLTALEEERRVPVLVAGIPIAVRAELCGLSLEALEELLIPALAVPAAELRVEVDRVLGVVQECRESVIVTGGRRELRLKHGERRWNADDGCIDQEDRQRGAIVSNLPGGSVYTTVLESETEGTLWLPRAGQAVDVELRFHQGRVVEIAAASGASLLTEMFDKNSGEPRRISHIGIGLNPYLHRAIGWTLIDEHVHNSLFIAFGENRYMGGKNSSSLNVDFHVPDATFIADGRTVVE